MKLNTWLDKVQTRLATSPRAVRCAVKVRNQAQKIISGSMTDGGDASRNGEYRIIQALIPHCRRAMDIGAHRGDWTAAVLECAAGEGLNVIAYEPGALVVEALKAHFAGNSCVEIRPVAVGAQSGTISFFEDDSDPTQSSAIPSRDALKQREVSVVTVDDECRRLEWTELDFLKIDAEGLDAYVLRGASEMTRNQAVRFIQFEYNSRWRDAGATLKHCVRQLESQGYHVWRIMQRGLCETKLDFYSEYWGYSNYLAVRHADLAHVDALKAK